MKSRLAVPCFVALLSLSFVLPATAWQETDSVQNQITAGALDDRWLSWLGCWELVADAVDYREVERTGRRIVCVAPRLDGRGVNLTTQIDAAVIAENTVIADGTERPLPEVDCSGMQSASWSADGRRVISSVSASCGDSHRSTNGLSMLISGSRWLELQSIAASDGSHRELVVRHYDRLNQETTTALGYATLEARTSARAASQRASAAAPLTVGGVIETREKLPMEVVEAAIVESGSMFDLDADALLRLVNAGVDERTIDLMVAVSFPEEFVVDAGSYGGAGGGSVYGGGGIYGGYIGFSSYYGSPCWGNYYSPFYGPYGPSCGGWYYPPRYYGYRPPYYGGGGGNLRPVVGPGGSLYGGKVISRRGYSASKEAVNLPEITPVGVGGTSATSGFNTRSASDATSVYNVRRAVRRNDGGDGGGGSVRGSNTRSVFNSGGSVSRRGFSRPGGSSAGSSSGSSSSGASSSGARKAKAKPKGGGGS